MKELIFKNSVKDRITMIVEPWAIELEIEPDSEVLIKDDLGGTLDFVMEYFLKGIILYFNSGAISVYENKKKIF